MPETSRSAYARAAALTRVAMEGGAAVSAPARAAWHAQFERAVDPDGTLDPAERARRADALRRAHMTKLAAKSAAARAKRRALDAEIEHLDAELEAPDGAA